MLNGRSTCSTTNNLAALRIVYTTIFFLSRCLVYPEALAAWDGKTDKCTKAVAHCTPIPPNFNRTCLGNRLPYKLTSPHPIMPEVSKYNLDIWTALRSVPACWDKLQFFLCSVYLPECIVHPVPLMLPNSPTAISIGTNTSSLPDLSRYHTSSHRVILPELEMCEAVHKACPLLISPSIDKGDPETHIRLLDPLPRFLDCSLYTRGCRQNKLTPQLFQSTGSSCKAPFVTTEVQQNWLPGFERCSFPCRRPYFDEAHYTLARIITGVTATVCLLLNVFTLITLHLQQQERRRCLAGLSRLLESTTSNTLPTVAGSATMRKSLHANRHSKSARHIHSGHIWCFHTPLFYMHLFFLIGCLGWLMPSLPFIGDYVACRDDGSLRTGEPQVSSNKSVLCIVNFMAIYFSLLSAAVWANIFDYMLFIRTRHLVTHLDVGCSPNQLYCKLRRTRLTTPNPPVPHSSNILTPEMEAASPLVHDVPSTCADNSHGKINLSPMELPSTAESNSVKQDSSDVSLEHGMLTASRIADQRKGSVISKASIELATDSVPCASCRSLTCSSHAKPLVQQVLQLSLPTLLFGLRGLRNANYSKTLAKTVSFCAASPVTNCPQCAKTGRKPSESHRITHAVPVAPRSTLFHTVALAIPLILVLISLTAAEVDGDSLSGICFVGRVNWWTRIGLVLIPFTTSLVVKLVYLSRTVCFFKALLIRFNKSVYPVDQEFAHRLARCTPSLGTFLVVIISIWLFSFCVQLYTYFGEPMWSESQRAFILCQLSHRLLGLSESAARTACAHSMSTDRFIHFSPSTLQRPFRHITSVNDSSTLEPTGAAAFDHLSQSPNQAWISRSTIVKPVVGPLLLHLFAYFALNCLFISTCLLDRSVKRCWRRVWFKLCSKRHLQEPDSYPLVTAATDAEDLDAWLLSYFTISSTGYSWWDPGIFNLPLTDELLTSVAHLHRSSGMDTSEGNRPVELSTVLGDASALAANTLQPSISVVCGEPTNSCVTSVPVNPDVLLPPSVPCNEDIIAQLTRLISLYDGSSEEGGPASLPFRHLLQQLLVSYPSVTSHTVVSTGHSAEPHFSSHTSFTRPHSVQSEHLGLPADSTIGVINHPPDLVASMAAVYEQCQKQLAALSGTTRPRTHHRRLLPGRFSGRRHRSHSRSLSTNGAFCNSLLRNGFVSGPGSTVSGATSNKRDNLTDDSLSLLKAAASVVAAASMRGGKNENQSRLSQCGIPLAPVLPFELSSSTGSACEGSQVSSSSVRSAAAGLTVPMTSSAHSLISRPFSAADTLARHLSTTSDARRSSEHCDPVACLEAVGSRMSLRSLSCASSYGAESYNSYRLLLNQSGASWRELWRTRMLLMDVLKWAEAVAPLMQANRKSRSSLNEANASRLTSNPSILRQSPSQTVSEVAGKCEVGLDSRLSQLIVSSAAASQFPPDSQPLQQTTPLDFTELSLPNALGQLNVPFGMDSLMAAAFAAATVAATVAWKQHQQLQNSPCTTSQDVSAKSPTSHQAHDGSTLTAQLQQSTLDVSSSLNATPFRVPGSSPPMHSTVPPFAVATHPSAVSFTPYGPLPHVPPLAWPTVGTSPRVFQPPFASASTSAHCLCPMPQSFIPYQGYPYGVMVHPHAGYRVSPDLLADHDRSGIAFASPNYTPPFVAAPPRTTNFRYPSDRSPQPKPPSLPVRLSFPTSCDEIVLTDAPSDHRQPPSYAHRMERNIELPSSNRQYHQSMLKRSEEQNDSDAFDSEDEVMSASETPGISRLSLERAETSSDTPLIPIVYPDNPVNQMYFMPVYSHVPHGSAYPFYPPNEPSDCVAPSSILGGADDGEVSTVSQSASQVIPREPSPPGDDHPDDYCPSSTVCSIPVDPTHLVSCSTNLVERTVE